MSLALLFLALLQGGAAAPTASPEPTPPQALASVAPAALTARVRVEPARVEVGEPFRLVAEVEHPAGAGLVLPPVPEPGAPASVPASAGSGPPASPPAPGSSPDGSTSAPAPSGAPAAAPPAPALDGSWVLLGSRLEPAAPVAGSPEREVTRRVVELASLEPGNRALPSGFVGALLPAGVTLATEAAPALEVRGVLAKGEDAPRPLRELPEDFGQEPGAASGSARWPWIVGAGVLVLAALSLVRRLRRRRAPAALEPTPAESLAALGEGLPRDPALLRERAFELTRLLRGAADRRTGVDRSGRTDQEWSALVQAEARLPGAARERLVPVLERCATIKYGGVRPTEWALREILEAARDALAAVEGAGANELAPTAGKGAA